MKTLRVLFTKNLPLKVFSLALGFVLWRLIASEEYVEVGFTVPLELRNIPPQFEIVGDVVNNVNVRVRASASTMKHLTAADISASVDLSQAGPGERMFNLTGDQIQTRRDVEVVRVSPPRIRLKLERTRRSSLPVALRWNGDSEHARALAAVERTQLIPAVITVEGPESHVRRSQTLFTEPIPFPLTIEKNPWEFSAFIDLDDPFLRLSHDRVQVKVFFRDSKPPSKKPSKAN